MKFWPERADARAGEPGAGWGIRCVNLGLAMPSSLKAEALGLH